MELFLFLLICALFGGKLRFRCEDDSSEDDK